MRATLLAGWLWLGASVAVGQPGQSVQAERLRALAQLPRTNLDNSVKFNSLHGFHLSWTQPDPAQEIARLSTMVQQDASDAESSYRLAEFFEAMKKDDQSREYYQRAAQASLKRLQAQPDDGWLRAQYARAWYEVSDKKEEADKNVETCLRQAVQAAPNDWRCWIELGKFIQRCAIGEVMEEVAKNALVFKHKGRNQAVARMDEARTCYDRAISVAPTEPRVFAARALGAASMNVCRQLLERADGPAVLAALLPAQAVADLYEAARLEPDNSVALTLAASTEHQAARIAAGEAAADRGFGFLPRDTQQSLLRAKERLRGLTRATDQRQAAEAWECLAMLELNVWSDATQAEACFRRALELNVSRKIAWHMLLCTLARTGQKDAALNTCRERLRHLDTPQNHLDYAYTLEACDELGAAQEQVSAALAMAPKSFSTNLAQAVMHLKYDSGPQSLDRAKAHLDRAKEAGDLLADEQRTQFSLHWGLYLALAGNQFEARLRLRDVLKQDKDHEAAKQALAILDDSDAENRRIMPARFFPNAKRKP